MPTLQLSPPTPVDLHDLFAFEMANRVFFEQHINARSKNFYSENGVAAAISDAERDANADKAHQYLARDDSGALVARVDLTRVRREHFHSTELGCRVAQAQASKQGLRARSGAPRAAQSVQRASPDSHRSDVATGEYRLR